MAFEGNTLRRATKRLEARRKQRSDDLERRKQEVYQRVPAVAALDRQLKRTIADIIAASLRAGEAPGPAIETVRQRNLDQQAQRTALLTGAGFPADYLDEAPFCAACGDSGWIGTHMCACLRELCAQEQMKELSKLLDLGEQSFQRFSLDYYAPGGPREQMQVVYDICWKYAHDFRSFPFKNLYLTGAPGLGKTFLSACIARTVSEQGFSVVYDTAVNIFAQFEEQKFSRDRLDAQDAKDETRRYLHCDLLILDDLGSEMTTPFVQSALYTLVNARLTGSKRTVISSNLDMDQAKLRYSPQVYSRLNGEYHVLRFIGQDIRLQKKEQF